MTPRKKMKLNNPNDNRSQDIASTSSTIYINGKPEWAMIKQVTRYGYGESTPTQGDQVIYHIHISSLDGKILESTRSCFGGKGIPSRHVLGRSKMILGLLEGLKTMKKGEIAKYIIEAKLLNDEDVCKVLMGGELCIETELIDFSKIEVIGQDLGVLKKVS